MKTKVHIDLQANKLDFSFTYIDLKQVPTKITHETSKTYFKEKQ